LDRECQSGAWVGFTDEPQPELGVLLRVGRRWCLEHEIGPRLRLGERHDLADRDLVRQERGPTVDPDRDAAMGRGAVLERIEDRSELLTHSIEGVALQREAPLEHVAAVDPDGTTAELPAVEPEAGWLRPGP